MDSSFIYMPLTDVHDLGGIISDNQSWEVHAYFGLTSGSENMITSKRHSIFKFPDSTANGNVGK